MNVILGALVRRIKQRAYLDTDEEIARWIEEYCEQSNSHKHGVSGKQQIQWQAIEAYLDKFGTNSAKFNQVLKKQAREWFEREFVACASGAVDTSGRVGCVHNTLKYIGPWYSCEDCGTHFNARVEVPSEGACDF